MCSLAPFYLSSIRHRGIIYISYVLKAVRMMAGRRWSGVSPLESPTFQRFQRTIRKSLVFLVYCLILLLKVYGYN